MNPTDPTKSSAAIPPGRILVIDDEPDLLVLLQDALGRRGYVVLTAESGLAGLNLARRELPDLILLDVILGDMDGFSVCELLRIQPSTARTPIIMMTALAGELARFNGFEAGAIDYVTKPINLRDVAERVAAALSTQPVFVRNGTSSAAMPNALNASAHELPALSPRALE